VRLSGLVVALSAYAVVPVHRAAAQCPDGTPPPCAGERRARQETLRRAAASAPDSSTALVVPLAPIGTDNALRRLGADFAAIVADNMTAGEVEARVAADLGRLPGPDRPRAAAWRHAGAVVEGSLVRAGAAVRIAVRLVEARTARELATTTVQGLPDNLLALADLASAALLKAWWKAQPGPHARGGLTTSSLPALRHYAAGMAAWRRGDKEWIALLDSAVRRDPGFVAAWLWLGLPQRADQWTFGWEFSGEEKTLDIATPEEHVSPDSARRALRHLLRQLPPDAQREAQSLGVLSLRGAFDPRGGEPPTPRSPEWYLCQFDPAVATTVEERYLGALAFRIAALLGCSDTAAVHAARSAFELDPGFTPAWELLFDELLAAGDTAGLRSLIARYPGTDTTERAHLGDLVAIRRGAPAVVAALDSEAVAGVMFVPWHRFREAPAFSAAFRRKIVATLGSMGERFEAGFRVSLELPTMLALGQLDSARAALQAGVASTRPGGGAQQALHVASTIAWFPPDTAVVQGAPDAAWLDSLDRRLRSLRERVTQAQLAPEVAELSLAKTKSRLLRTAWFAGALAIQRRDLATGRRAAALLDSARGADSVVADPLRNDLRAELALAADSGSLAESLLVEAISGAWPRPPARYLWLLARRYADSDQPALALRLARSLTMPTSWFYEGDLVLDRTCYYAPALRLEGEMLERLGRRDEALARYREFVELRSGADPPLQPEVAEVRGRIARLAGAGGEPPR
jgi:hypothetical protein